MAQQYSVEFTVGVLEKLAGIKKPKAAAASNASSQGVPSLIKSPAMSPEAVALARADAQLSKALQSSRQVGGLLLKQEEEELTKIRAMSEKMSEKFSKAVKAMPCEEQRSNVLQCYQQNPSDPLKCSSYVKAYSECSRGLGNQNPIA